MVSYGFPMVFPLKHPSWCLEDHGDLGMTHPTEALWSETAATILAAGRAPFVFFGTGWNLWKTIGKWRFSLENHRKTIGKPSKIWRVSTINPWRFQLELVGFVNHQNKKSCELVFTNTNWESDAGLLHDWGGFPGYLLDLLGKWLLNVDSIGHSEMILSSLPAVVFDMGCNMMVNDATRCKRYRTYMEVSKNGGYP